MIEGRKRHTYLCLAYEEESSLNAMSPPEWHELRAETLAYVKDLEMRGHLVRTNALQSSRTAITVRVREGQVNATDGPFAETKEQLGGFFLIEAADISEAVRLAAGWPSARLGSIEVRPVEPELKTTGRYEPLDGNNGDTQPAE